MRCRCQGPGTGVVDRGPGRRRRPGKGWWPEGPGGSGGVELDVVVVWRACGAGPPVADAPVADRVRAAPRVPHRSRRPLW
ncbi:hypothetical protein SCATT_p13440 (plasmid) [Streptantibioticus cattleyicolor NRRL 8057 = DSM 46488]|uniref:Uncharacterized protein n=1 Tax=Streptantibioticus cattleyicolor (strain ATCC 35852 / DSM 46488 / JCM 4925 / NBRC 14057 / NRRL 8057) TaxID=1003195 RepID=G8XFS6_STREN|nr:hypothetical protein SCATT_p13440 [Streptantibioticus cattleyicolor NRRL 8057 = DSM 46488]